MESMFSVLKPSGAFIRWSICNDIITAHASMTMVIMFCTVMKTRENIILVCFRNVPRTTSIGFTRDSIVAGSAPAARLTSRMKASMTPTACGLASRLVSSFLSNNWLA